MFSWARFGLVFISLLPSLSWSQTSVPEKIYQKREIPELQCERTFIYEGKELPCDSKGRQDLKNLRSVLSTTPSALESIENYEREENFSRLAGYTGLAGLSVLAVGLITQNRKLYFPAFSILGITGVIAFSHYESKDYYLNQAIQRHNEANPDKEISLKLSTEVDL